MAAGREIEPGIVQVRPNPMRGHVEIRYRAPGESRVRIGIYDVAGRLVREFLEVSPRAGEYNVVWDGMDMSGRPAARGSYFVRMAPGAGPGGQRLLVIR